MGLFLCVFFLVVGTPGLCPGQSTEYILKAGFLEKFARFTDWPDSVLEEDSHAPFVISVIGNSPFGGALEKVYKKTTIKNRPVKIQHIDSVSQIPGSHILFVCKSETKRLGWILETARNYPILIISDTRGFAQKGTHINLYITSKGTLHFEINPKAAKRSGLTIQIILLEIAKIVGG